MRTTKVEIHKDCFEKPLVVMGDGLLPDTALYPEQLRAIGEHFLKIAQVCEKITPKELKPKYFKKIDMSSSLE